MRTPSKIEIFFAKLFSKEILKIGIVATIIYLISGRLGILKSKIDNQLNADL